MRTYRFTPELLGSGDLILVNGEHPLRQAPEGLTPVPGGGADCLLLPRAARAVSDTLAVLECGERIVPVSAFRSHGEQIQLYADCLRENGPEYTAQFVAKPGCSEHETGLAIDLGENREEIDFIAPAFPYQGVCHGFRLLAPRFGLIQRYEAGKEPVTGIGEEPWHFRYVGTPHSEIMVQEGLNLEEYVDWLRRFSPRMPLRRGRTTVFFLPYQEQGAFSLPDGPGVTVSGNNVDGCIVTIREVAA